MPIKLGIPRETTDGENRVSIDPVVLSELKKLGIKVFIEKGAGKKAFFPDSVFNDAIIVDDFNELSEKSDVVWWINPPSSDEVSLMHEGAILIGALYANDNIAMLKMLEDKKITSFSLDLIPKISRSQSMDVVSSQASAAGYKAAVMAADVSSKFIPMLNTPAGLFRPSNVMVIGAGIAGLQAIATVKRMGAVVKAYDFRPEAKEKIHSLGAESIDISLEPSLHNGVDYEPTSNEREQQQHELANHIADADILILTVLSKTRAAPKIVPQSTINLMKKGSVIIDLVAEHGGNCTLTKAGQMVMHGGVAIHGPINLPSQIPNHASSMYAQNMFNFMKLLLNHDAEYSPNFEDEIVLGTLLTKDGEVMHEGTLELLNKTLGEK